MEAGGGVLVLELGATMGGLNRCWQGLGNEDEVLAEMSGMGFEDGSG